MCRMIDYIKYARLFCDECECESFLTKEQYDEEMNNPNAMWRCRNCGTRGANFDDEYWEANIGITEND